MAINGYTEDQIKQLVHEIRDEQRLTLGPKRRHDDSSSEVPMIHSASMWLLADSITKDNSDDLEHDLEQSASKQLKKRRRRGKRNHRSKPGPKSGQSGPSMVSTFCEYVS